MMISLSKVDKLPELTLNEIQQYLSSGLFRGIGKKTAQTLVNYFGYETLSVLDAYPEKLESIPDHQNSKLSLKLLAWVLKRLLAMWKGNCRTTLIG